MAKSADDAKGATPEKTSTQKKAPTQGASSTSAKGAGSLSRSGDPSKRAQADEAYAAAERKERHKARAQKIGNPPWFVPVMLGLMVIGLVWVVTFYITKQAYPVESWGTWNLGAGFAFILAGFAMTTRWK
ncbi:cell division protein CrgA [Janibacter sp. GS2]|uniref:cell division protein CrgA n=1 Tax=Janibacter sp. GS2 TaxID=3442646 RepID=UPI003EBA3C49